MRGQYRLVLKSCSLGFGITLKISIGISNTSVVNMHAVETAERYSIKEKPTYLKTASSIRKMCDCRLFMACAQHD